MQLLTSDVCSRFTFPNARFFGWCTRIISSASQAQSPAFREIRLDILTKDEFGWREGDPDIVVAHLLALEWETLEDAIEGLDAEPRKLVRSGAVEIHLTVVHGCGIEQNRWLEEHLSGIVEQKLSSSFRPILRFSSRNMPRPPRIIA
ncbi:hypothetical protein PHLCEN_2v9593 [Hermanssonia centrifuga]|uniref:Uncharacterized protein n=1 Tax=Hermanssonia centrifuga TaxID=98765 RepID=A0A2R6NQ94_9APHY|nr:hypothetical protein PHLCEN_2v9593 [Hermanssonia centrifuga]